MHDEVRKVKDVKAKDNKERRIRFNSNERNEGQRLGRSGLSPIIRTCRTAAKGDSYLSDHNPEQPGKNEEENLDDHRRQTASEGIPDTLKEDSKTQGGETTQEPSS